MQSRQVLAEAVAAAIGPAAQPRFGARAGRAGAAGRGPGQDDEVAELKASDAWSELLDHGGALVTEHDAGRTLPLPVHDVKVRVADAGRDHADEHLSRPGGIELKLLDPDRLVGSQEHGTAHLHAADATRPDVERAGPLGTGPLAIRRRCPTSSA